MTLYDSSDHLGSIKKIIIKSEKEELTQESIGDIDALHCHAHPPEFVAWIEQKVAEGNSYAQDYLGDMYYYGTGVTQDRHKATELFKLSAAQNNPHGQYNLSYMYFLLKTNESEAQELAIKSMMNGCKVARTLLNYYSPSIDINNVCIENYKLKQQLKELQQKTEQLQDKVDQLTTEINYMPGGPGYEAAKADAESLFVTISSKQS